MSTSARSERKIPRGRETAPAQSLWARGEPVVWVHGAGLLLCVAMIAGLIGLVAYQGLATFWPARVMRVQTLDGEILMGEKTRTESYVLTFSTAEMLGDKASRRVRRKLMSAFRADLAERIERGELLTTEPVGPAAIRERLVAKCVEEGGGTAASAATRAEATKTIDALWAANETELRSWLIGRVKELVAEDRQGRALQAEWTKWLDQSDALLGNGDLSTVMARIEEDPRAKRSFFAAVVLTMLSEQIEIPSTRLLLRIGNFELSNEHFRWVGDFETVAGSQHHPKWAVVLERLAWGRFYGAVRAFQVDGEVVAQDPSQAWSEFERYHPQVRRRWREKRALEKDDVGRINAELESARLDLRRVELRHGTSSAEYAAAREQFASIREQVDRRFADIRRRIESLDQENARYRLILETSDGQAVPIPLATIVRGYLPNQLGTAGRWSVYGARWWEFLSDEPREANTEGGVLPAIWGTVAMTLLMAILVLPLGVLAALYLHEYAREGVIVSVIRVAVNNLAGIPSIVFGVFGLGFFCYIIGARLDELFFAPRLPSPTFGTGGLLWASLTLALLTLPVVIVATEEALAAVPRSIREGSLACGATQWQTIRRIVLPRALPGILTGMILAMARGAGEVAPLMLVGAVKLAPQLPVDGIFPYMHLERSFMHLGFHIYDLGFQSQSSEAAKPMVFTTALLLMALVGTINLIAVGIRSRLRRQHVAEKF